MRTPARWPWRSHVISCETVGKGSEMRFIRGPGARAFWSLCLLALVAAPQPWSTRAAVASRPAVSVFVEPQAGDGPVLSLLKSARSSIRLEMYEFTQDDIFSALKAAKQRHVSVQVLLEQHPYGGGSYAQAAYSRLQQDGISVRWANETAFTYTHEKAVDVDNAVAGIFTFNFSYSAFSSNREFGVIDRNSTDAKQIGEVFQADWNRSRAHVGPGDLVVSPVNSRSRIEAMITHARHSLDLYEEEMDDPAVERELSAAARRGVKVRLITSDSSSGVDAIRGEGVKVVIMANPYVHAKAIVADADKAFIGSENISSTSLDNNREMGIIVTGANAIGAVESAFNSDWKANGGDAKPPKGGGKLTLKVSADPTTVKRYDLLTILAQTKPQASCTIVVTYPDGYVSQASELQGSRTANGAGQVTWSWHVGSTVTGTAHAAVTCTAGSSSISRTIPFHITS